MQTDNNFTDIQLKTGVWVRDIVARSPHHWLAWSKVAENMHYDPVYIRDLGAKAMQKTIEAGEHLTLSYTIK